MQYQTVAKAYEEMGKTTKRLELTYLLVQLFKQTPPHLIDKVVYFTQGKLYPDYTGIEIGVADKLAIRAIAMASGTPETKIEKAYQKTGDVGEAAQEALSNKTQTTLFTQSLTVQTVYDTFDKVAKTTGQGSLDFKIRSFASLLNNATPLEAKYILRTATGTLRLGIADYTVLDALAEAFAGGKENRPLLERAYNQSSDLGAVAKAVQEGGLDAVKNFKITVGRPIRPMLAERLETSAEILEKMGDKCAVEYKLDGERLQIHKKNKTVTLFSRRLENITSHYPDVREQCINTLKAQDMIAEAEAVAINLDTGEYLPFQELMHRRRKYGISEAVKQYPVAINFFDVLYVDGEDLTSEPYRKRRQILQKIVAEAERVRIVPAITTGKPEKIDEYMQDAITEGCEGLVAKELGSPYRAGAREFSWVKLKREYRSELMDTVDLVIVGGFHGRGKRAGRFGTYLLAAYDKDADMFRTVTKVGTGFSDEELEKFPKLLEPHRIQHVHARVDSKMQADVWFEPRVVIEVAASEITLSPIHTGALDSIRKGAGLALRFPKFTGHIRDDKAPEDATTTKEIVRMYRTQLKKIEEPLEAHRVKAKSS
ncbi:MAG: ATP-dependent DNA ligase [Thaumarchaeota archaeon]|nr:ATP-dependent DNA ligase [Nitrososphaerota archaeon]